MCGIAGLVSKNFSNENLLDLAKKMVVSLRHRGPDNSNWVSYPEEGVALAHQRLSIIDTSQAGNQPMRSTGGRFSLVYNGEIYNYQTLRESLIAANFSFTSTSDTEVLLNSIMSHGVKKTCSMANGMFAFALWDHFDATLTLVRDRFGQKPLYYSQVGENFYFSSELKSFASLPQFKLEVDRQALSKYFQLGYVPAPLTIYDGIKKLEPGSILKFYSKTGKCKTSKFWSSIEKMANAQSNLFVGSKEDAIEHLRLLLSESVSNCLVSDVPIGAFLSSGIDSATVVAIMAKKSSLPIKTFSVGFENASFDESKKAEKIANYIGTEHSTLFATEADILNLVPSMATTFDEPFADESAIPTLLISNFASKSVKVALTGDGGDEIFSGYNRYKYANILRNFAYLPKPLRWLLSQLIIAPQEKTLDKIMTAIGISKTAQMSDKMVRFSQALEQNDVKDIYNSLTSIWPSNSDVLIDDKQSIEVNLSFDPIVSLRPFRQMMIADTMTYLPGCILTKLDRATMSASLEARAPLLDHRLFEFSWSLPDNMLLNGGITKKIFREVSYQFIPESFLRGPKMGFSVPLGQWLGGPLRDWAEELLQDKDLEGSGLNPTLIRNEWAQVLNGRRSQPKRMWAILMFRAWEKKWL